MTRDDESFYSIMGPFLSNREIVKELGAPVWDDPGKIWLIAIARGNPVGFAAIEPRKDNAVFVSAWVSPDFRGQGIYDRLVQERVAYVDAKHICATSVARLATVGLLEQYGFVITKQLKNYAKMRREAR